eukprot:scaffold1465_cov383-Prasinococcus_capsulatus_cf.AAC.14
MPSTDLTGVWVREQPSPGLRAHIRSNPPHMGDQPVPARESRYLSPQRLAIQVGAETACPDRRLPHLCARVVLQRLKVLHVGLQLLLLLCDSVRGPPALLEALHLHDLSAAASHDQPPTRTHALQGMPHMGRGRPYLQPHKLAGFLVRLQRFDRIRRRNRHVGAEGAKQELRLQVTAVLAEIGRFLVARRAGR